MFADKQIINKPQVEVKQFSGNFYSGYEQKNN